MNLDEELMLDAQQDAAAVAYIKQHLPQELKDVFTEELLYYFIDVIVEYYTESGILDATPRQRRLHRNRRRGNSCAFG